jgi:phosphomannomutase
MQKRLIAFDLDGTLATSKQAIDSEMGALLAQLSGDLAVAVISGGDWPQFEQQLLFNLPEAIDLNGWFLLPTSGTKLYRRSASDWRQVYAQTFSAEERVRILAALDAGILATGLQEKRLWGERIEDRGSQITFSGLGQHAPLDAKTAWDPDFAKRKALQAVLMPLLTGFAVRTGGSTSVDITRAGIDKAYGMRRLAEVSGIATEAMIFIGDALYPGGNDYAVKEAGIDTIAVRDVHETKRVLEAIILYSAGLHGATVAA